jgi:hypothetical protein
MGAQVGVGKEGVTEARPNAQESRTKAQRHKGVAKGLLVYRNVTEISPNGR